MSRILLILLSCFCLYLPATDTHTQMRNELSVVKHLFALKYAPAEWKKKHFNWNLETEYKKACEQINQASPTKADYRTILKNFLFSTKDYHVKPIFYSSAWATLPIRIKEAEGRYFISEVGLSSLRVTVKDIFMESQTLDEYDQRIKHKFHVGDELFTINGVAVSEKIESIITDELGGDHTPTGRALAIEKLTSRRGKYGDSMPKKQSCLLTTSRGAFKLQWISPPHHSRNPLDNQYALLEEPIKGFLPYLGEVVWESDPLEDWYGYVFKIGEKKFAFVRINDFDKHSFDAALSVDCFIALLQKFEELQAESLVIDLTDNRGGELLYAYALLSTLTHYPLITPKVQEILISEDIHNAFDRSQMIQAKHIGKIKNMMNGYPVTEETLKGLLDYYQFIAKMKELQLTPLHHGFGIETIMPHPKMNYSKPILVLVDEKNFSAAEIFAAILQDNQRAKLFGRTTAGAGGYVKSFKQASAFGVKACMITSSILYRSSGTPIENIGVHPDIYYEFTIRDLQENYIEYIQNLIKNL